jgi:hypothetical protein
VSYNASVVKIYNAAHYIVRFKNKDYFPYFKRRWRCSCKHKSRRIGSGVYVPISFVDWNQGDQIGRIFSYWTIVYFGQSFLNYKSAQHFKILLFIRKSNVLVLTNTGPQFGRLFRKLIWSPWLKLKRLNAQPLDLNHRGLLSVYVCIGGNSRPSKKWLSEF